MLILYEAWVPGQGVRIDYSAIVDILLSQLDGERTCRFSVHWQAC